MASRVLLVVLVLFVTILAPLAWRIRSGNARTLDADRLRRTYVALSLYENDHDALPAPNLGLVIRDLEPLDLQSVADPSAGDVAGSFPLDPMVANLPLRSRTRVSWSYRWHWPNAGDPRTASLDPRCGLLADPWPGSILRVNMDGSLVEKPAVSPATFAGLFGR